MQFPAALFEKIFGFFRKKTVSTSAFDSALKRLLIFHEACMLCIQHRDFNNKEQAELATNLYFLGAVDCSSQRHSLSDKEFGQLIMAFFTTVGLNEAYAMLLLKCFLKMNAIPSVKNCIIEGGQQFNKWLNGNSNIPLVSMVAIETSCNNIDFPKTAGQLYVALDEIQ